MFTEGRSERVVDLFTNPEIDCNYVSIDKILSSYKQIPNCDNEDKTILNDRNYFKKVSKFLEKIPSDLIQEFLELMS